MNSDQVARAPSTDPAPAGTTTQPGSARADLSRRSVLIGGAGAGVAVLAACASSNTSPAATRGGGSTATENSSSSGGAQLGQSVAALNSIPVGQGKSVTLPGGAPGIVARPTATTAACFSAICTHQGCTVNADGARLVCPCHGSQYDALTGKVLQGPAPQALARIPVKVVNGNVVTA